MLVISGIAIIGGGDKSDAESAAFKRMTPAEHLHEAKVFSFIPGIAIPNLEAIPQDAPEYKEVPELMKAALEVKKADEDRRKELAAHPPVFSEADRAAQLAEETKRAKLRPNDSDNYLLRFWSTTVRVDTDMDSFWLNGEQRKCTTSPDDTGRVATVTCNYSASHQIHNIPVDFYGPVDTNRVSSWTCTRKGDSFECRTTEGTVSQ